MVEIHVCDSLSFRLIPKTVAKNLQGDNSCSLVHEDSRFELNEVKYSR